MDGIHFNISAVERDTRISKDVLRVWEKRYGFPQPIRDDNGKRLYPLDQVERLRVIKSLMDQGHRPGKLLTSPDLVLDAQLTKYSDIARKSHDAPQTLVTRLLSLIKQHDVPGFQDTMQEGVAQQGLARFIYDTVVPLTRQVGEAWECGEIEVFEEHLFTELTTRVLRQAMGNQHSTTQGPRILLTTVQEEQHVLGLLMVETLLTSEGATCIPLGTQTPLIDIHHAALAHRADIVALSFASSFKQRQIPALLQQLRTMLPGHVALWAGGRGVTGLKPDTGICYLLELEEAVTALHQWRTSHATGQGT